MAAVRHLELVKWTRIWTTHEGHEEHLLVLIVVKKIGWNRCSSFDNIKRVKILCVWLENAYPRPSFGIWLHKWKQYERDRKRHLLAQRHVIWRAVRDLWKRNYYDIGHKPYRPRPYRRNRPQPIYTILATAKSMSVTDSFYCAMHYRHTAKRGLAIACRLSVCRWRWWIMTT